MLKIWMPFTTDDRNIGLMTYKKMTIDNLSSANDDTFGKVGYGIGLFHCDQEEFENTWTIAMWVKRAAWTTNGSNDILCCKNTSASTYCQWYFSQVSGKLNIGVNGGSGGYSVPFTFTNNVWIHVAAVYDGRTVFLYGNGELLGSKAMNSSMHTGCTNIGISCRSMKNDGSSYTGGNSYLSDFRIYSHALHDWEIKKIYNNTLFGVIGGLHLKETANLGGSSISYNGRNYGQEYSASVWGGDGGKIKFFKDGGYNNFPYKEYHKTASGSGGMFLTQTKDIVIESGKTYTMSIYVKSNRNFTDSAHAFNINGVVPSSTNYYITYGKNVPFTTEWNRISRTFTATTAETGNFSEMSILYNDAVQDYYVYYSGFQIESGNTLTPFTYGHRDERYVDLSGFDNEVIPYNITQSGSSFYFNGTNAAIKIPLHKMISGGTWSINLWFYRPNGEFGTKSWETLVGGQSGFELEASSSSTKTLYVCPYSWGGGKFAYDADRWNMVTLTRTSSGSKLYINGSLVKSGSAGSMPTGNYFIGAWKTYTQQNFKGYIRNFSVFKKQLTDEDVMNLYIHGE